MATSTTFDNCSVKGELIDCDKPDFYMFNSGIRMIALGSDFCLALDVKGNVLSWGECSSALGYTIITQYGENRFKAARPS